jgi:hypothetical protein
MFRLSCVFALTCALVVSSVDAAQRTFVSVSGLDASPSCSIANPCRSFAKAITVTDPDGEIIVLDSGGYGRVTIDRSVSITAPPGIYGGISVFSGQNGIDVNAPNAKVALRGLSINGQGGNNGIVFSNGAELHVDGCVISNLTSYGLEAHTGRVFVHDTSIRSNGSSGIAAFGTVIHVERSRLQANGIYGIYASSTARVDVRDSLIADNDQTGIIVIAGALTRVDIDATTISGNRNNGVYAIATTAGTKAELSITRSVVARNGEAGAFDAIGASDNVHLTVSDNMITGNYGDGISAISGATVVASDNAVTKNAQYGFFNSLSAFKSRGDNAVQDNGSGPNSGTITTIGGL